MKRKTAGSHWIKRAQEQDQTESSSGLQKADGWVHIDQLK